MNINEVFHVSGLFLLALTLGGMVFFAAIMTPLVFTKLPPQTSGPFIRQVFPVYSMAMAGLSLLAAVLFWKTNTVMFLLLGVFILFIWAWLWLTPRINRYRDAQLDGNKRAGATFNRLHKLSVGVNVLQMGIVAVVFIKMAI
ncbi:MAG: hypothetical protein NPINA01_08620 [Nitrospinaceae bacterium]|nr:MAG: hypothetical protein NPINA01_08620 [Nitrospinaceae bacterium]